MITADTSAIIAVLLGETGYQNIEETLASGALQMCAGTYAELLIVTTGKGLRTQLSALLAALDITFIPVDAEMAEGAGDACEKWGKGRHPASLNFGDCFAYALAKATDTPLLFVGNDFAQTDVRRAV